MQGCNGICVRLPAQPCMVGRMGEDETNRLREQMACNASASPCCRSAHASSRLVDRVAAPDVARS